jgi:hypothetical protein
MRRRFKTKIPISTINNWIKNYGSELPATKLRKKYDLEKEIRPRPEPDDQDKEIVPPAAISIPGSYIKAQHQRQAVS